jgi:MFS transporter, DHA1 family, inner membrane transport protein
MQSNGPQAVMLDAGPSHKTSGTVKSETKIAPIAPGTSGLSSTFVLALGTFAVGTDAFIVSAFLPAMADSLRVSPALAGQSVISFTLAYALLSPIIATLTSAVPRRQLLIIAMLILGVANIGSALAPTLWVLIMTRIVAAAAAASYTPSAGAVAAALVRPELKGRALAVVIGGLTSATAVGVPLGRVASSLMSWRMSLVFVGVIAVVAAIGLTIGMPGMAGNPPVTLKRRLSVLVRPGVMVVLPLTVLGMAACYTPQAFTIQVLRAVSISDNAIPLLLASYGIGAVIGNFASGAATDRWNAKMVLLCAYVLMLGTLGSLTWLSVAPRHDWSVVVALLMFTWGLSSWAQGPAQQARLIAVAPSEAPLVIALNASAIYFGFAIGSTIGSLAVDVSVTALIGTAAALSLVALAFAVMTCRERASQGAIARRSRGTSRK